MTRHVSRPSRVPGVSARGYRWPAEWEPHRATWLSWPHNPETWPGRLEAVQATFAVLVRLLHAHESVCINVADEEMEEDVRKRLLQAGVDVDRGVEFHRIATDDAWVRDHGPLFVVRDQGEVRERALVDFRFDAWGRKYEPFDRDAAVPRHMADSLSLPRHAVDLVLEGGALDGNGRGTVLTTESCLLHPNRGPGRTREGLEQVLRDALGATNVLWLGGALVGDDTDGHIDDLARFVDATTVVAAQESDPKDPNFMALSENLASLGRMVDQDGSCLDVVPLPMPPPLLVGGVRCPASYLNFYLANGLALVPVFSVAEDERALAVLGELLPDRAVVGVPCTDLVAGFGAIHCVTQQEPAPFPA
jgi:agmatine deiminase